MKFLNVLFAVLLSNRLEKKTFVSEVERIRS